MATPNADRLGTQGWSELYRARRKGSGGYEVSALLKEGEAHPYPSGLFQGMAFERLCERVDPGDVGPGE